MPFQPRQSSISQRSEHCLHQ